MIRDYRVFSSGVSLFCVAAGDGKVGIGPWNTHITSRNFHCCIDGVNLMSSRSSDYLFMGHYKRDRYYFSLSGKSYDQFSAVGDGRGGVCPRSNHFYSQKFDFGRERHDMRFIPPKSHHIASPMVSSWAREYSVNSTGGSSFGVADGDGKYGVGTSKTYLNFHRYDFWFDSSNFV